MVRFFLEFFCVNSCGYNALIIFLFKRSGNMNGVIVVCSIVMILFYCSHCIANK